MIFLTFWLAAWPIGEISAIVSLFQPGGPDLFLLAWLGCWTIGGLSVLASWAWMLVGKEEILVDRSTLSITNRLVGLKLSKSYDTNQIRRLRVSPSSESTTNSRSGLQFGPGDNGLVVFDYGATTVNFGSGIDEAEATLLVERIAPRLPSAATSE